MSEKHYSIKRLEGLFEPLDRGALAQLRRAAGHKSCKAYKYVPAHLPKWEEETALIIAPLFALWHQGKDRPQSLNDDGYPDRKNLGFSLSLLAWEQAEHNIKEWQKAKERIEKRLNALLDCHVDDLATHLRYTISLLKSADVKVNWEQLRKDINNWDHYDRYVQKNWARSFWTR